MSDDKPERIPQHRHCLNCGKAFVGEGDYCDKDCEDSKKEEIKKKRNILLIIWLIAVAMMVFAIFFMS